MTTFNKLLLLALLALSFSCQSTKEPNSEDVLTHRIMDNANILTAEQEDSLIAIMETLEEKVGSQIAILTVPSLDGQKIEEISLKTANDTGLGRATYNDGVLITVAYQDRQTRIEVGTGLENILKDEIAAQIIREDMAPKFVEEKFGEGLYVAVQRIAKLIEDNEQRIGQGIE
jgi:uncharacterized protein